MGGRPDLSRSPRIFNALTDRIEFESQTDQAHEEAQTE